MTSRFHLSLAFLASLVAVGCSKSDSPTGPSQIQPPVVVTPTPTPTPDPTPQPTAPSTARYTVVFDSTWNANSHPTDFPDSAHYSGLIGGTHNSSATFWQEGALASEGIKRMAERGSKAPLDDEVNQAIGAGTGQYLLSGPALGTSPASTSMDFEISSTHPLVTLVTMVAPSPDWFAGVSGLPLFQNGQWRDDVRVELYGYDAGTDSGMSYSSPDRETIPRQPIARLGYPLVHNGTVLPLGTFTFKRLQ